MSVVDELKDLLVQVGAKPQAVAELTPDQAVALNVLDSVGFPSFIAAIEEKYAIRVSDRNSVKLRSLKDFRKYIEAQLGQGGAAAPASAGLAVDGSALHYEIMGDGPNLLMLNGIGLDLAAWGPFAAALAAERTVLLLDARGSGRSGPAPEPCTTATMAADALALLDYLNLGKVEVLGLSLGGLVAQELALLAPGRVRSLVLAATAPRLPGRARRTLDAWRRLLAAGVDAEAFRREQFAWVLGAATLEDDALTEGILKSLAGAPSPSPQGFAAQAQACLAHDTRDRAARIAAPALVLAGQDDVLVPPSAAEALSRLLPRATFEVHPGGHAFLTESAGPAAASVLRFLRSVELKG